MIYNLEVFNPKYYKKYKKYKTNKVNKVKKGGFKSKFPPGYQFLGYRTGERIDCSAQVLVSLGFVPPSAIPRLASQCSVTPSGITLLNIQHLLQQAYIANPVGPYRNIPNFIYQHIYTRNFEPPLNQEQFYNIIPQIIARMQLQSGESSLLGISYISDTGPAGHAVILGRNHHGAPLFIDPQHGEGVEPNQAMGLWEGLDNMWQYAIRATPRITQFFFIISWHKDLHTPLVIDVDGFRRRDRLPLGTMRQAVGDAAGDIDAELADMTASLSTMSVNPDVVSFMDEPVITWVEDDMMETD